MGGRGEVTLDLTSRAPVAVVTLRNPAARNALSPAMMVQLAAAVDELARWDAGRAVVLTGAGGAFCAGADLASSDELFTPRLGEAMRAVMADATARLSGLPLVSVAAVEGAAVGGGVELATAADFRVCTAGAVWHLAHVQRGATPGWGGLARLAAIAGRKNALFLAGTGARLGAAQAAEFQLVDAIVGVDGEDASGGAGAASADWGASAGGGGGSDAAFSRSIVDHAVDFLAPFLEGGNDPAAGRALKGAMGGWGAPTEQLALAEAAAFRSVWGSPGQLAVISRFRKPQPPAAPAGRW